MPEPIAIDLDDLRSAVTRILDAYEGQFGRRITIDRDHYWHLPVGSAFDMGAEPIELTVGQLTDDLQELVGGAGDPSTVWHDLAHAIGLLRALEARARP